MRKLLILSITCLMGISAMAQDINAVKFVQGQTTDWYLLSDHLEVTFNTDHNPMIAGQTYDLANGIVETSFGTAPADTWFTVRTDGVIGDWNTICMEHNITAIDGATFWTVSGETETAFVLDEVTEPQAGYGYLINFTAAELKVQYGDETASEPVEATNIHPVQGTFAMIEPAESNVLTGNYVVHNNQLRPAGAWVGMKDHRAYVVANLVPDNAPAPAPGRARVYMSKPKETPTDIYSLPYEGKDGIGSAKFLRKGQLIIVKDNKMYNAQGMKL